MSRGFAVVSKSLCAIAVLVYGCTSADSGDPSPRDAGGGAFGGLVDGECVVSQCTTREGTALSGTLEGNRWCGASAEGDPSFVQWMGPRGTCRCNKGDGGTLEGCELITPEQCAAQTSCGSCNAISACAWCPSSGCLFRPAFGCDGGLSRPSCE